MNRRHAFLVMLVVATMLVVTRPAQAISDAELDRASREQAAQVEAKSGVVWDRATLNRVDPIFARVKAGARSTRWPLQLRVLNDPSPNAYSLPNGQMYVNIGLLRMGVTDDELAFVLSHEAAHVTLQHGKKAIEAAQWQGTVLGILLGKQNDWVQLGGQVLTATLQSGFSREHENAADSEGLATMQRAAFTPRSALTFFAKLQATQGRKGGISLFPSHPLTADRVKNVQKWLALHGAT